MSVSGRLAPAIVVRGDGPEALFAAATLAQLSGQTIKVAHVLPDVQADVPPAVCIPAMLMPLLRSLGIDTAALIRAGDGTFHLGTAYVNGNMQAIVADGALPASLPPVRFAQLLWDLPPALRRSLSANLTLNVAAAHLGSMPQPDDDAFQEMPLGLHLRTLKFSEMLAAAARRLGVVAVTEADAGDGTGCMIDGQWTPIALTIDAYTDRAAKQVWHVLDAETAQFGCTRVEQHTNCRRITIPLQGCTFVRDVPSDSPELSSGRAVKHPDGATLRLFADCPFDPHPDRHWRAMAVILPFLRERLSVALDTQVIVRSFDTLRADLTQNQKDTAALAARLLGDMASTAQLERRTAQFQQRGRVVRFDSEIISETELLGFLMANDIWPNRGDLLASQIPRAQREAHVNAHTSAIGRRVAAFIRQQTFLERAGLRGEARDG